MSRDEYISHTGHYIHMRGLPYGATEDDVAKVSATQCMIWNGVIARKAAGGSPFRATRQPTHPLQLLQGRRRVRRNASAARATPRRNPGAQGRPQFGGPSVGTVGDLAVQQLGDDRVLLGAGDQPRRRAAGALRRQPQHRERVAVHAADQRFPDHRGPGPACCEPSSRAVNLLRACAPIRPEPVSSRTDSGSVPAPIRAAATSISSELLPVPGPPSTRNYPRRSGSSTALASGPQWKDIAE